MDKTTGLTAHCTPNTHATLYSVRHSWKWVYRRLSQISLERKLSSPSLAKENIEQYESLCHPVYKM